MRQFLLGVFALISAGLFAQIPSTGKVEQFTFNNTLNGLLSNNLTALKPQYDFDRFGNANSAYKVLIDSNCIVNVPVNGLPLGNADRSICLWVKNLGASNQIRSYFNYSHETSCFGFTEETSPTNKVVTNYTNAITTSTLADNSWHCLIGTQNSGLTSFYIDGVLVGTNTITFYNDTNQIRIGRSPALINNGTGILYPNFLIDELIIYNRSITSTEAMQICSAGSTSIEESVATSMPVTIFPNPANNLINIESEVNCSGYEITDFSGKTLVAEKLLDRKTIRINLPQGIYLLKLSSGNNSTIKKLIVQ
jgi:hypothetical protein